MAGATQPAQNATGSRNGAPQGGPGSAGAGPGYTYYQLSSLLGARLRYEDEASPFGRLYDIGGRKTGSYPQAVCLEVETRGGMAFVPWSAVKEMSEKEIVVRRTTEAAPPVDIWVRRDVLDDQVVDVSGAKVRRVNDVHLAYTEGQLVFGHVEIGVRGILRRLGVERPARALLRWLFDYSLKDRFVTWRHIEVLSPGGSPGGLRVSAFPSRLADIHPAELADIMEQIGVKERQRLFNALPIETAAGALEEVSPEVQRSLLSQQEPGKAADILEEMPSKEAAGVLRDMAEPDAEKIITRMESDAATEVEGLLAHSVKTAGGLMVTQCIEARPEQTAADVLEQLRPRAHDVEVFNHVYVLDDARHLLGLVTLRELLSAAPGAPVQSLMTKHPVKATPDTRVRVLVKLFEKYGFRAIPVVDDDNVFLGSVRLSSILTKLSSGSRA